MSTYVAEAAGIEPAHRGPPGLSAFKAGALPLCQTSSYAFAALYRYGAAIIGARGWGRTIDARAFNAALYRLSYPGKKTSWRNVLDSNQWANSRRPRLSKPAPWTTRPTFLILWCPQRCSRTRPAAYRAAALPLSYGGESSSSSIRLCPCAKDAHCCAPDRFAAHQGRPGAHGALARSWARSKAIVQGHTRIERETAGA